MRTKKEVYRQEQTEIVDKILEILAIIKQLCKVRYKITRKDHRIYKNGGIDLIDVSLFDLYKDENLPKNSISLAYSLTFKSNNKTLTDKEIDKYMDNIIKNLKKKLNIIQR